MRQKINPVGFRLGIVRGWDSNWYGGKTFSDKLVEDQKIREYVQARIPKGGIAKVVIERTLKRITLTIHTARPGIIIGRKGAEIEKLREDLSRSTGREVLISIQEIRHPELNAQLQAEKIAQQLEKRIAFRRAMKKTMEESQRFGAQGIKVMIAGRLNGAEIARTEWSLQGRLPLHTLRADIDFGFAEALTTFGIIGVKVWIYRGEILDPNASMARGTTTDPMNEVKVERGARRNDRGPRRDRGDR